jgi:hypothetical protein
MNEIPRDSLSTFELVTSSDSVPSAWMNEWNATGMTIATTAMPDRK